MHSITCDAQPDLAAPVRMVWLPGAYHSARDFLAAGFPEAVTRRALALDLTFVDLELRYLDDRTALTRLHAEIIVPAVKSGAAVWLAGISLGGLIALDYAATYTGDCEGLCLLAPYLGNRLLIAEIESCGLAAWEPGELAEADTERRIWRYMKTGVGSAPVYLGFGRDDRFSRAHALLAKALPADRVDVIDGGHEWRTWTTLWEKFLDSRFT